MAIVQINAFVLKSCYLKMLVHKCIRKFELLDIFSEFLHFCEILTPSLLTISNLHNCLTSFHKITRIYRSTGYLLPSTEVLDRSIFVDLLMWLKYSDYFMENIF